jgi:alpha-ketoglutarate-dependent taurine dioxygenase
MGDLKKVRDLLYEMQRPAISPENVFAHEWQDGDMVIFHNRGVLHSVVGSLKDTDSRVFHQCNISSADEPIPVTEQDFAPYTVKAQ